MKTPVQAGVFGRLDAIGHNSDASNSNEHYPGMAKPPSVLRDMVQLEGEGSEGALLGVVIVAFFLAHVTTTLSAQPCARSWHLLVGRMSPGPP
jgi:hypothetical protein